MSRQHSYSAGNSAPGRPGVVPQSVPYYSAAPIAAAQSSGVGAPVLSLEPEREAAGGDFPSYQLPTTDVYMSSPRHSAADYSQTSVQDDSGASQRPRVAAQLRFAENDPIDLSWADRLIASVSSAPSVSEDRPEPAIEVFRRSAERTEVEWPTAALPSTPHEEDDWVGLPSQPPRRPRDKTLPASRGFKAAIQQTWLSHNDPPKLDFVLEVDSAADIGLRGLPPVPPALAHALVNLEKRGNKPQKPFDLGKTPPFVDPKVNRASQEGRAIYTATALGARDLNALALLLGSLSVLLGTADKILNEEETAEMGRIVGMCTALCRHATQWNGRVLGLVATHERQRWLSPLPHIPLPEGSVSQCLAKTGISPQSLFDGGVDVLRKVSDAGAEAKELSGNLRDLQPPQIPAKPTLQPPKRDESRGRSHSRHRGQSGRGRTTAPPPSSFGRPQQSQSLNRQADNRASAPTPAPDVPPPRQQRPRSQSKGRHGGSGK